MKDSLSEKISVYSKILFFHQKYRHDKERFVDAFMSFLSLGDYFGNADDDLLDDLFSNGVRIGDGERAFRPDELEEFWQEIEQTIVQMRQIVASQERS
jgi:hypothetical protein